MKPRLKHTGKTIAVVGAMPTLVLLYILLVLYGPLWVMQIGVG